MRGTERLNDKEERMGTGMVFRRERLAYIALSLAIDGETRFSEEIRRHIRAMDAEDGPNRKERATLARASLAAG